MDKAILIAQISSTLALAGVVWLVQVVQYPFFSCVEKESFRSYHAAYTFRITPIVAPLMVAELLTSLALLLRPPQYFDYRLVALGAALTLTTWASTFFIQIPLHDRLAGGFDAETHRRLVRTNWIRTVSWTFRAVLVLSLAWTALRP